jgi:subtilisin
MTTACGPIFFDPFAPGALRPVQSAVPHWLPTLDGSARGAGVKVAILDSGVAAAHPVVAGSVAEYIHFAQAGCRVVSRNGAHTDAAGHGTACAGIIRALAPECTLASVKVLDAILVGRIATLAAGLEWAIESGARVCNLSLGSTRPEARHVLHELAERARSRNVIIVAAANNHGLDSAPANCASVISVAAHRGPDQTVFYANPDPPVDFWAPGVDVEVAMPGPTRIKVSGNSFAAPWITGQVARLLSVYPAAGVAEIRGLLGRLAANAAPETRSVCSFQ